MGERGTDVLQQYDLDVIRTSRVRGAVLCETRQGCKLLQEYKGTESRLEQVQEIIVPLEQQTGICVDRVIANKEGKLLTADTDQTMYVVKEWNSGRECDLLDERQVLRSVGILASLHQGLCQANAASFKNEDNLMEEYTRHTAELRRARNYVRKVRHKSEFELCVMESFGRFFQQAEEAVSRLTEWEARYGDVESHLCHGDYSHHHILYDGEFAMVTDFMSMSKGIQMSDLYYFMRKTMEKQGFCCELGQRILEEYNRCLPLTTADCEYLYIRFLYPEKYWKQINYYYNSNKAWIPARNTQKIRVLGQQEEERQRFLRYLETAIFS